MQSFTSNCASSVFIFVCLFFYRFFFWGGGYFFILVFFWGGVFWVCFGVFFFWKSIYFSTSYFLNFYTCCKWNLHFIFFFNSFENNIQVCSWRKRKWSAEYDRSFQAGKDMSVTMTLQTYKYKRQPASSVHSVIANRALLVGTAQGLVWAIESLDRNGLDYFCN